ncbi:MAG TPA: hypothetical protein PLO23_00315 [Alphaproteobacteria bacterium]|nr:hypothetical protein [Alphaproteobacteria bacterium]
MSQKGGGLFSGWLGNLFGTVGIAGIGADVMLNDGAASKAAIETATGVDIEKLENGQIAEAVEKATPVMAGFGVAGLLSAAGAEWSTIIFYSLLTSALIATAKYALPVVFNTAAAEESPTAKPTPELDIPPPPVAGIEPSM